MADSEFTGAARTSPTSVQDLAKMASRATAWCLLFFTVCSTGQTSNTIRIAGSGTIQNILEDLLNVWTISRAGVTGEYVSVATRVTRETLYNNLVDASISLHVAEAVELLVVKDAAQYPLVALPLVPLYNIPELAGINVVFSGRTLARIYMGNLTRWDDPELQALNPSVPLPAKEISAVSAGSGYLGTTDALTLFLSEVDEGFRARVGNVKQVNWTDAFPGTRFVMEDSQAEVARTLLSTPYSFAVQPYTYALQLGMEYGYMLNRAGQVVAPSDLSMTAAMLDHGSAGIRFDGRPLNSANSDSRDAWPIPLWAYLNLRKEAFRDTCALKAATVEFFKWMIDSPAAREVAAKWHAVILPPTLDVALEVTKRLTSEIMCDGQVSVPEARAVDIRAASTMLAFEAIQSMLAAFRDQEVTATKYQVLHASGDVAMRRTLLGEIDLAAVIPSALSVTARAALQEGSVKALGLWSFSIVPVHSVPIPEDTELVLDVSTLGRIWSGDIRRWDDPAIAALNKDLADMGALNHSITYVVQTAQLDIERTFIRALAAASDGTFKPGADVLTTAPAFMDLPHYASKLKPSVEVRTETAIADVIGFVTASIGIMPSVDTRLRLEGRATRPITILRNGERIAPSDAARAACEVDTYDAVTGTHNLYESRNPECYPFSALTHVLIKSAYTGDCGPARRSLTFNKQVFSASVELGRLDMTWVNPAQRQASLAYLDTVTCNGEPVLVLLPDVRRVPAGVEDIAIALSSVLIAIAALSIVFTWYYRRRHALKAASPVFMIITLIGIFFLVYTTSVLPKPHPDTNSCTSAFWFLGLGLYLTFAPLFAKVWRVYKIFFRSEMQVIRLPDRKLFVYIAIPFIVLLCLLVTVQAVDPLRPFKFVKTGEARDQVFDYCGTGTTGQIVVAIVGVLLAGLVLFGAVMAFSTRNVAHTFNESKTQAFAIYNVLLTAILVIAVSVLLDDGPSISIVVAFSCFWMALVTWATVFLPRAHQIYASAIGFIPNRISNSMSGNSASHNSRTGSASREGPKTIRDYSIIGVRNMEKSTAAQYLALLEKELTVVRVHIAQLSIHDGTARPDEASIAKLLPEPPGKTRRTRRQYQSSNVGTTGSTNANPSVSALPPGPAAAAVAFASPSTGPAAGTGGSGHYSPLLHVPESEVLEAAPASRTSAAQNRTPVFEPASAQSASSPS